MTKSWFVLHGVDVLIHNRRVRLRYGYILVGCFFTIFRALSEIFILWGTWRVLIRYKYLRPNTKELPRIFYLAGLVGLLWLLALYHLCLLFGLSFAWLSFSDLHVINSIAKARSVVELSFTALYFICTLGTIGGAWRVGLERLTKKNYPVRIINSY